jgi:PAS domain S-box-containing protein
MDGLPLQDEFIREYAQADVTERKQIEEALKVSEVRYRRLFETAQDGILLLDAHTGRILDANPFLLAMLGYSYQEVVGRTLWEIGPFKDVQASQTAFQELQQKKYIRYEDLPLETKDGRMMDVEFVSNVYPVDGEDIIQCNVRDITDRKRAEEALRRLHANAALQAEMTERERAEQGQRTVVLEERNRIARDIHDTLAQGFTGIIIQLEAAEDVLTESPEEARAHLLRAKELARESLAEARRSLRD